MAQPLFLQPPYLWILYATAGLVALREVITRRIWRADEEERIDRGSFRVLWAATTGGTAVAVLFPFAGVGQVGAPVLSFWLGIALMLGGFLFRMYAMLTLGRLFSHRVAVKDDHEVIVRGPYRWVRHPSYTGAIVTYLGIGVVTGNWVSVCAVLAGALAGYGHRIRIEERALRAELDGYEAYAERTPYRLVPGIW
ncbi:methyltransferase family protein [Halomicrobium salinisoli]|uniref:methyltransferase family protein n=1 Tax=Halomicrobium salinisoli TaxID=2878391 RepID=UPI001CF0B4B6|nr:isoprenylcysteine carboxylmethyltransferase family protein [Halomicrobium salinisoli]